tara:strand:+ start:1177 stop:2019 length:843 start_codon:yes stop_codon:yes gene_type:complete
MIIWIASYPKSGNTWTRAMLSSYFYSKEGLFDFEQLESIKEFPKDSIYLKENTIGKNLSDIAKEWIPAQKIINKNAKEDFLFLKTHSSMCSINSHNFTNAQNSLGGIYIIRDPRNVVTSLGNHYNLSIKESLKTLFNKHAKIQNPTKENFNNGLSYVSDWGNNYISWKKCKHFKIKIVKYEDLVRNTEYHFTEILLFLKTLIKFEIDKKKIKNVIKTTNFNTLKSKEKGNGFKEQKQMSGNDRPFFDLGPKRNWKKILDTKTSKSISDEYKEIMMELDYL